MSNTSDEREQFDFELLELQAQFDCATADVVCDSLAERAEVNSTHELFAPMPGAKLAFRESALVLRECATKLRAIAAKYLWRV